MTPPISTPRPTLPAPLLGRTGGITADDGRVVVEVALPAGSGPVRASVPPRPQGWLVACADAGHGVVTPGRWAVLEVTPDGFAPALRWLAAAPEARGLPVAFSGAGPVGRVAALAATAATGTLAAALVLDEDPGDARPRGVRHPVVLTPTHVVARDGADGVDATLAAAVGGPTATGDGGGAPQLHNHAARRALARVLARRLRRAERARRAAPVDPRTRRAITALSTSLVAMVSAGAVATAAGAAVTTGYDTLTGLLSVTSDGAADGVTIVCDGGGSAVLVNGVAAPIPGLTDKCDQVLGIDIDMGSGNDTVDLSGVDQGASPGEFQNIATDGVTVGGGLGNDTIRGPDIPALAPGQATLLDGNAGNDSITGGSGSDSIRGGLNDDALVGGGGANIADFSDFGGAVVVDLGAGTATGAGADTLSGFQNANGGPANDLLVADSAITTLTGNGGDDTLVGAGVAPSTLVGGDGRDSLSIVSMMRDDLLLGGDGSDTLSGLDFADTLIGGPGDDSLNGGLGVDSMSGEAGNDTLDARDVGDTVHGGADSLDVADYGNASGPVTLSGQASDYDGRLLTQVEGVGGSAFADSLRGGGTGNALRILRGGGGADTLTGVLGSSSLAGGTGADVVTGPNAPGLSTIHGDAGDDTLGTSGTVLSVTALVDGGTDDDLVNVSTPSTILGGSGSDTILGPGLGEFGFDADGGADGDSIRGAPGPDTLRGDGGNDTIDGGGGTDSLLGGNGNDLLDGGGSDGGPGQVAQSGADTVRGDAGSDTISGGFGDDGDDLDGGSAEIDRIDQTFNGSQALTNTRLTGHGTDTIAGFERASLSSGASGTLDASTFSGGPVTLVGGAGEQTLLGTSAADSLVGGNGLDEIRCTENASHTLTATTHATGATVDTISGIERASLAGGNASNLLDSTGFTGRVTLDGGAGNDTLRPSGLPNVDDSLVGGTNTDVLHPAPLQTPPDLGVRTTTLTPTALTGVGDDTLAGVEAATLVAAAGGDPHVIDAGAFPGRTDLTGASGDDTLVAGTGVVAHSLAGGGGTDEVRREANTTAIVSDTLIAGAAPAENVTLDSIERVSLRGGAGAGLMDASSRTLGGVTLAGLGGADTLVGADGIVDRLEGGDGDDSLLPGVNAGLGDIVLGGPGTDDRMSQVQPGQYPITNDFAGSTQISGLERITLIGDGGPDSMDAVAYTGGALDLVGLGGNDTFIGGSGGDTLDGGAGADRLQGRAGADSIVGGADADSLLQGAAGDQTLTDTLLTGQGPDSLSSVENVSLAGDVGADLLDASAFTLGPVSLLGGDGDDTLRGGTGNDILGGDTGDDIVVQSVDADQLVTPTEITGMGTDQLDGIEGASLEGGASDNVIGSSLTGQSGVRLTLAGHGGADELRGSAAPDLLLPGPGSDSVIGGAGVDSLTQTVDADQTLTNTSVTGDGTDTLDAVESVTLVGGAGANVLDAGGFAALPVSLSGLGGADTLVGSPAPDTLDGGAGVDDVVRQTANGTQTLTNTQLTGGVSPDGLVGIERASLIGGVGADLLDASAFTTGPVTLSAGGGQDTLRGGAAGDVLDGGGETDRVEQNVAGTQTLTDTALTGAGTDTLGGIERAALAGTAGANVLDASSFTLGPVSLTGLAGPDTLRGGTAAGDALTAGDGDDVLFSQDALVDADDCGTGDDTLTADVGDTQVACETVNGVRLTNADGTPFAPVVPGTPVPPVPPAPPVGADPGGGGGGGTPPTPPAPPTPTPTPPPGVGGSGAASPPDPAKLQVLRAQVRGGRLDVLAQITARATGSLRASYRSGGRTTSFAVRIPSGGRLRISQALPAAQRRRTTGILTLTYAGADRVRATSVRLRAASGRALMTRGTTRIRAGRLEVAGTISRLARGVVRLKLGYVEADGSVKELSFRARIVPRGSRPAVWSVAERLPARAAQVGGQVDIEFTGYEPRLIRGEQLSKQVDPSP